MKTWMVVMVMLLTAATVQAEIVVETVEYKQGEAVLEGKLVYENSSQEKRPAVLVVHQWMGPTDYELGRAKQLAGLGYVALVANIYGKGVRASDMKQAGELAGKYRGDRNLMRARALAGLNTLKAQPLTDPTRVAAIGYCFGGGVVLELARSGAELSGVVSFHGNLDTPNPADAKNIKTKLLVLHGAKDPYVPEKQVQAFHEEMKAAKVDYEFVAYPGAVHAFSQKMAGDDPSKGAAYNAEADRKSWVKMKAFFEGLFKSTE